MKKKKVLKTIVLTLLVLLVCFFLYNFINCFRFGKQTISVSTTSQYYNDSNMEAIIDVKDKKNNSIKSNIRLELLDGNGKRVVNEKYKKGENENVQISIPLSQELETGKYDLKIISTNKFGFLKDVLELPVNVISGSDSKIIISLDKGIYKPGDDISFRALLISKRDETPVKTDANIYIYDGNNNKVYSYETQTSEYGIVSGNFKLADEVNSGTYRLVVSTDSNEVTKTFTVNPYIIPQFEVSVLTDKENYRVGEKANITVNAKYFFGENVQNATVTGTVNNKEIKGVTDTQGNFTTTYDVNESGKIDIKIDVIDSSNYLIEGSKTLYASKDAFEIEVLPEYGDLLKNIDNNVYVLTKTINGTPIKTHSTIVIGNVVRQVITDENGMGTFTLTSSDVQNINTKEMKITSENSEGNSVSKTEEIAVVDNYQTIINTNKVKYNCGDDLEIKLISNIDLASKEIYFCKGNELIKIVSSENEDIKVNLENISGLVDIYVKNDNSYSYPYYKNLKIVNSYSKKTIFIKPDKKLNIDINLEAEEYAPGEKLNIEFNTTDEKNNKIDSSLLVSILDEAILNLAENDLSIDNIKVALEDIELSENITAADLYANIIDDSSELMLQTLLLKQSYTDPNIYQTAATTKYDTIEKYEERAFISFIIITVVMILLVSVKLFKSKGKAGKFATFVAHAVNIIAVFVFVSIILYEPIQELYYEMVDGYRIVETLTIITNAVIAFVLYLLVLQNQKDYIFNLILDLVIIPLIYILFIGLMQAIFKQELLVIFICLILFAIWAVLVSISKKHQLNNILTLFKYSLTQMVKFVIVWIAMYVLQDNIIDSASLTICIVLGVYILFDKYVFGKTKIKKEGNQIILNITGNEAIVVGIGILFIVVIFVGIRSIIDNFSTAPVMEDMIDEPYFGATFNSGDATYKGEGTVILDTTSKAPTASNKNDFNLNFFNNEPERDLVSEIPQISEEIEKTEEIVENVRNIFLESLAFIPELVTEQGTANLSVDISDNITTWNIQTLGNSKQGNLGYSSKEFKVFKEFFVDYTLPTNSVVTDKVEIPVTLYNYTEAPLNIEINVKENDWSNIGEYQKTVSVPANSTSMIYIPIEIIKSGNNTFRVETNSGSISDIVEKNISVSENGLKIEKLVSSGAMQNNLSQDIIYTEKAINDTKDLKIKLYPASITQVIENMESILQLPSGCFEQTSSSLYPDILVLKYLQKNNLDNQEIREKALKYISKGYQKLLTYEVEGTKGGYSLYGDSPAEPVITAFGLMEMNELSSVYDVDEKVISNMKDYLFSVQKSNGTFDYLSTYIGSAASTDKLAMNSYITWALSEVCPDDSRITKSVEYLKKNIKDAEDSYTLALMANVFINTGDNESARKIINTLNSQIKIDGDTAYLNSNNYDYYGCYGRYQDIQVTALASMALTKDNSNLKTNQSFINYIIKSKSPNGTWGTTQNTILALKAINDYESKADISDQTITVRVNDDAQSIDIKKNNLDIYEMKFENLSDENKVSIEMKKGKISYEIIKEYYKDYAEAQFEQDISSQNKIIVEQTISKTAKVNENVVQNIHIINKSNSDIANGLVQINIPQGCSVNEDSLMLLKHNNLIEKYEYNYGKINLYLRNFANDEEKDLEVQYRALYPETITGGAIRVNNYYNPEIEGISSPNLITITSK